MSDQRKTTLREYSLTMRLTQPHQQILLRAGGHAKELAESRFFSFRGLNISRCFHTPPPLFAIFLDGRSLANTISKWIFV